MNNQKGSILISLLLFIVVLSILSVGIYRLSYSAGRQARFLRDNSQAYYLAKAGADLTISNIEQIIKDMEDNSDKNFEIEFPNEGKAVITLEWENNNRMIIINSTGVVNEGKGFESRSSIQARLNFDFSSVGTVILGVDNGGVIYNIDKNFENFNPIYGDRNNEEKIPIPNAFAWNGTDKLLLVGSIDKNEHVQSLISSDGINWEILSGISDTKGKGLSYVVWSEEENRFYATNIKEGNGSGSGHLFYLSKNGYEWDNNWNDFEPSNNSFDIAKLAQGNSILVGISNKKQGQITYFIKDAEHNNNHWEEKTIDENYEFNGIIFGRKNKQDKGHFIIVGENRNNPLILSSKDSINWKIFIDESINGKLKDIIWTGDKFVAVGENIIYVSEDDADNGIKWNKINYNIEGNSFNMVSSYKNYIIAYSDEGVLFSKDGGSSWIPKEVNDNFPELRDIIVINKNNNKPDFSNPIIHWSK
ncbi:hypothetical protein [Clostridium sp. Cult2]|uniref:hypothetical protein n=1 Tax=Clostridium sp. Cult2 TaxID=2079003 RepID=UPI001F39BB2D|nr:hypothetical protein [Clostridium sp. Cult2]MCF6465639.1 hypothetical protein [Clostridium sp. Cult2]